MFTRDDLVDTIMSALSDKPSAGTRYPNKPGLQEESGSHLKPLSGRHFLTEHVIKKTLTEGARHLTIPEDAIVSPLAQDWLVLKGIRIIRSGRAG